MFLYYQQGNPSACVAPDLFPGPRGGQARSAHLQAVGGGARSSLIIEVHLEEHAGRGRGGEEGDLRALGGGGVLPVRSPRGGTCGPNSRATAGWVAATRRWRRRRTDRWQAGPRACDWRRRGAAAVARRGDRRAPTLERGAGRGPAGAEEHARAARETSRGRKLAGRNGRPKGLTRRCGHASPPKSGSGSWKRSWPAATRRVADSAVFTPAPPAAVQETAASAPAAPGSGPVRRRRGLPPFSPAASRGPPAPRRPGDSRGDRRAPGWRRPRRGPPSDRRAGRRPRRGRARRRGERATGASTLWSPTICAQSVAAALGASGVDRRDRPLEGVGSEAARAQRPFDQRRPLGDLAPGFQSARSWSVEQDQLAFRRGRGGAARLHGGSIRPRRPSASGSGKQLGEEPPEADRLAREVGPRQRLSRRGGIPLVEHQVEHLEHGAQPIGQLVPRRHLVGDALVADLRIGAHDPLGQG